MFSAIGTGLTLATLITHIVYTETDKFFTKAERAHNKNFLIMWCELALVLCACVASLCKKSKDDGNQDEQLEQT